MKNRNIGIALRLLGFALTAVAALFTLIWFVRDDMHRHPGNLGTWLETALVFVLGTILWRAGHKYSQLGKKHCARSADDLVTKDSRPPVIYLRSFLDDPKTSNEETQWQGGGAGVPSMPSPGPTEEQQLAGIMNQIGPFIAIGNPTEKLPELGAARTYISEAEWKDRVLAWMLCARLVVLRGNHRGFVVGGRSRR